MLKFKVGDSININKDLEIKKCKVVEIIPDITGLSNTPDIMITNRVFLTKTDKEFRVDLIENEEFVTSNLNNLNNFLTIFLVIPLIMSALFIISSFQNFVHKYRKDFSVIHAVGGSAFQGFLIILLQAFSLIDIWVIVGYILITTYCKPYKQ